MHVNRQRNTNKPPWNTSSLKYKYLIIITKKFIYQKTVAENVKLHSVCVRGVSHRARGLGRAPRSCKGLVPAHNLFTPYWATPVWGRALIHLLFSSLQHSLFLAWLRERGTAAQNIQNGLVLGMRNLNNLIILVPGNDSMNVSSNNKYIIFCGENAIKLPKIYNLNNK